MYFSQNLATHAKLHGVISEKIFTSASTANPTFVQSSTENCVHSHSRPTPAVVADRLGSGGQVFRQCGLLLRLPAVHGALPHKSSSNRHFSWSPCVNSHRVLQSLHRILGKLLCNKCLQIAIAIWISPTEQVAVEILTDCAWVTALCS